LASVFVSRRLPGNALDRLAGAGHDIDVWPQRLPPSAQELRAGAAGADALLTMLTDRVDADLLDAAPGLKVVSNLAVGCDNVDVAAAAERGIPVGYTPGVLAETTADLAFALILAIARRLPEAQGAVRDGDWLTWEPGWLLGRDVHGATLGIVGLGSIGSEVARRAAGFDMTVIHHSSSSGVGLEELLEGADFVSLHCPLTAETRGLIGAAELERMKPTAYLINTARGAIVDQRALADALHAGAIAGAALDVTDPEPLAPEDPLLAAPNLIVLPHVGSATHATRARMAALAVDNVLAGLAGEPLPHEWGARR
jgi:glyoxylate reductase